MLVAKLFLKAVVVSGEVLEQLGSVVCKLALKLGDNVVELLVLPNHSCILGSAVFDHFLFQSVQSLAKHFLGRF
eukprot:COSAG03_NODE_461_length_7711_cov_2.201787_1_plen_74_part_00